MADDRLLVRRYFVDTQTNGPCLRLYDASDPESARAAVELVLNDREAALAMAKRARKTIENHHLWRHRLVTLINTCEQTV